MGIITRELAIDGPHGSIFGELYLPEGASDEQLGCVICSHGFNSTHASPARYGRRIAAARLGYAACAFDFFGGSAEGRSGGAVAEHSVITGRDDLLAVLDAIRALPEIDESRIVLEGHSQGGLVSALVAGARPGDIVGLMLLYPAFMIPDAVKRTVPSRDVIPEAAEVLGATIGRIYVEDAWDVDAYAAAAAYPGPVVIFQGADDAIVPPACVERAAATYPQAELVMLDGEGHGFTPAGQERVGQLMCDFLASL